MKEDYPMLWIWAGMAFLFGTLFGALVAAVFLLEDRELKELRREDHENLC